MSAAASKGLGKGLSALMGEEYSNTTVAANKAQPVGEGLTQLLVANVHSGEFQPRTHFDETYLHELADSIEKNGVMQPIVVRPSPKYEGQYEIIAGERRWRASKLAEIGTIPAIIREMDDKLALELALVENIQRQDLNVLEEAAGYKRLMDEFSYTQEALAHTVGKSRSHIANLLRLLSLPEDVQEMLRTGKLSMGHARALLGAEAGKISAMARTVLLKDMNVRQTEALVKGGDETAEPAAKAPAKTAARKSASSARARQADKDPDILALEETLSENLGLEVSIEDNGDQSGTMFIHYKSLIQLDDILQRLGDSI
jgi:ParB family chromosome partitioning protein